MRPASSLTRVSRTRGVAVPHSPSAPFQDVAAPAFASWLLVTSTGLSPTANAGPAPLCPSETYSGCVPEVELLGQSGNA